MAHSGHRKKPGTGALVELLGPPTEPRTMDPILPIVSILGYWAIILGSFGGPAIQDKVDGTKGNAATFMRGPKRPQKHKDPSFWF